MASTQSAPGTAPVPSHQYVIRGIFESESDPEFASVKTFDAADECSLWLKAHNQCTNPDYSHCHHIYTTLCDWKQVCALLLARIAENRSMYPARVPKGLSSKNAFAQEAPILQSLRERLDLPFHAVTNEESTLNTLRYLFFHMKCGIYVMIRQSRLVMFVPFVNKDYENNNMGDMPLEVELPANSLASILPGADVREYMASKKDTLSDMGKDGRREEYIIDKKRWWANGNIVCNVESSDYWGDSYLPQLRHMLQTVCAERDVPDCEFFINKRDFPHLKRNLTEPYDFIYDRDDQPLSRESYTTYAPIASFFVGKDFADLPLVTTDDWETATGKVFPPHCIDIRSMKNRKAHEVPWKDRTPTAFFRGNSTGPGVDAVTNQRIALAALSASWAKNEQYSAGNKVDGVRFLDAGLVGWNLRDRKLQGRPMTYIKPTVLGIQLVDRVPMYAQVRYKYHIYVDGHCAAMRYASMMPLGAVILKVDSVTKADSMWYFPLLRPYDIHSATPDPAADHVPVKHDLSDLADVIAWCKSHDAECEKIASSSKALYERLVGKEGQLDYLQLMCHEIATRFHPSAEASRRCHGQLQQALVRAGIDASTLVTAASAPMPARSVPGVSSLDATALAASAGCAPVLFAPAVAQPPFASEDWFGSDNIEYAETLIGPSLPKPPCLPGYSTRECECPSCNMKREAAERKQAADEASAAAHRNASIQQPAQLQYSSSAGSGSQALQSRPAPSSSSSSSSKAVSAAAMVPAVPKIANLEKAKAAALKAAALAKQKAAEAAAAAASARGGSAGAAPAGWPTAKRWKAEE